jgi:hypothetical protein
MIIAGIIFANPITSANERNQLHIIPEASEWAGYDPYKSEAHDIVENIWTAEKDVTVLDRYNKKADEIEGKRNLWMAFQTWVFNWNIVISYLAYLMRFLNQVGLLIWGIMILYAWYMYATSVFWRWNVWKWRSAIKNAVIWVIIIVASYAIWAWLNALFL